jgi:hypothetical protein
MVCGSTPWSTASIQGLHATHISYPLWLWGSKNHLAHCIVSETSNALACCFIICSSISHFDTLSEHKFRKRSLWDTISWKSDCGICGKCRESVEMVNRLFSWIFSSTALTKSSVTADGQLLRGSSCAFTGLSLKCLTHICTIESLMACSPCTSQSWWWMSAGFMFLAFKKQITEHTL